MKLWKKGLICLLTAALTLTALTGCSALGISFGTVQTDTEAAQKLMQEIDPALTYDDQLEYAAQRIADWMVEEPLKLSTSDGQFVRRVQLDADSGNMTATTVNEFIDASTSGLLYLSPSVKIGMTMNNEGNPYYDPGYLYAPAAEGAAATLRGMAKGYSKMGAVYIQYNGETYVVALFL